VGQGDLRRPGAPDPTAKSRCGDGWSGWSGGSRGARRSGPWSSSDSRASPTSRPKGCTTASSTLAKALGVKEQTLLVKKYLGAVKGPAAALLNSQFLNREAEGLTLQEVAEQHAIVERSLRLIGNNPLPAPERPGAVVRQRWGGTGSTHAGCEGLPGQLGPAPAPRDLLCLRRADSSHEGLPPR